MPPPASNARSAFRGRPAFDTSCTPSSMPLESTSHNASALLRKAHYSPLFGLFISNRSRSRSFASHNASTPLFRIQDRHYYCRSCHPSATRPLDAAITAIFSHVSIFPASMGVYLLRICIVGYSLFCLQHLAFASSSSLTVSSERARRHLISDVKHFARETKKPLPLYICLSLSMLAFVCFHRSMLVQYPKPVSYLLQQHTLFCSANATAALNCVKKDIWQPSPLFGNFPALSFQSSVPISTVYLLQDERGTRPKRDDHLSTSRKEVRECRAW